MTRPASTFAVPVALLAALMLAACTAQPAGGAATTQPAPAMPLAGAEWAITSINGAPVIEGSKVTIQFEDGRVFGAGSCNRFMGGYKAGDGIAIELSQMASTMMACPDALMAQEQKLLTTLSDVTSYSIAGNMMTLNAGDGRNIIASR